MSPSEQRALALAKANTVRTTNRNLIVELGGLPRQDAECRVASMLLSSGSWDALPVYRLLTAPRGIGSAKAALALKSAGVVSGDRRVRELTDRQRRTLASMVDPRSRGRDEGRWRLAGRAA